MSAILARADSRWSPWLRLLEYGHGEWQSQRIKDGSVFTNQRHWPGGISGCRRLVRLHGPEFGHTASAVGDATLSGGQKKDKFGYIDKTGKWVIVVQYDRAEPFKNGLARVRFADWNHPQKNRGGYINKTGKVVVPMITMSDRVPTVKTSLN